jgi:antirestriction protein ArdC
LADSCACTYMEPNANDKARKVAEEALNRLSAELEAGRSEGLKNYLAAISRFRRYSWGNVLLIASQRPTATHVAGYHMWNQLGRSVKKGEKGIMIFAPMVVKQKTVPDQNEAREPSHLAGFRTAYVFDVAQTEGRPLPEFAKTTGDPQDYVGKLRTLVERQGIAVGVRSHDSPRRKESPPVVVSASCRTCRQRRNSRFWRMNSLTR